MRLMRGRRRKFSSPRISNHRSSTGFTFVKNRWPPMSKRQPSRSAVRLMPPTTLSPSRTVEAMPDLLSWYAAVRPAGPAPTMTTSWRWPFWVSDSLIGSSGSGPGQPSTAAHAGGARQSGPRDRVGPGLVADYPISAHRMLGDGSATALVRLDGEVDWWCAPDV